MRTYKIFNSDKSIDIEIITDGIKDQKEFTIVEWPPRNYSPEAESIGIDWNVGVWNESTIVDFAKANGLGLVAIEEKVSTVLVDVVVPPPPVVHVESIAFNPATMTMNVGDTITPNVEFTPSDATDKEYTLTSGNENITVNGESITATAYPGSSQVSITATSNDGGKTATLGLSVIDIQLE